MLSIVLENRHLTVSLLKDVPVVAGILHRESNTAFGGGDERGKLVVNGAPIAWEDWQIVVDSRPDGVTYHMALPTPGIRFSVTFALDDDSLHIAITDIDDPGGNFFTLGWHDLPLLVTADPAYTYWRLLADTPDPDAFGKMWVRDELASVGHAPADAVPTPAIYGCLYWPDAVCAFVHSNFPYLPQTHQARADGRYAIGLNTYHHRVRTRTLPPLQAQIVFLGAQNGDGGADLDAYRSWLNRRLPTPDPIYRNRLITKVQIEEQGRVFLTSFAEVEKIVEAVHNVTDGMQQIVYLVGWQYEGHDSGYPFMDRVNERPGGAGALRALVDHCRSRYGAIISYHTNIDDVGVRAVNFERGDWQPEWNRTIIAGHWSPPRLCHTRDVESGSIFARLQAMLDVAPVEKTLHFDNCAITNTMLAEPPDVVGPLEELVCGLLPIADWLGERGITLTTEGWNGMPIDCTLAFDGFWHNNPPERTWPIFHRKMIGGGTGNHAAFAPVTRRDYGLGASVHIDLAYRTNPNPRLDILDMEGRWPEFVDRVFLGTTLYHLFLEHDIRRFVQDDGGTRIEYDDDLRVTITPDDTLCVTWHGVTIAEDDERFVPRGDAIYAYSLGGGERAWTLPEHFRGKQLRAFSLSKAGRGAAPDFAVTGDSIRLALPPRTPVKITIGED